MTGIIFALLGLGLAACAAAAPTRQIPLLTESHELWSSHEDGSPPLEGMVLHRLHVSGPSDERVDLTFFADGYTQGEQDKFVMDAQKLTDDIIAPDGAMGHVRALLNVWGVFVPSNTSGIGTYNEAMPGAAFGLYRLGPELRGVVAKHGRRVMAACKHWREGAGEGGCDQPIVLGNDPLYGGIGGRYTSITASELNGPLVLRHELGHSLILVGEEYDGGYYYHGPDADKVENLQELKWKDFLTNPDSVRVEDAKVPLQDYPWHNLSKGAYNISFTSSNPSISRSSSKPYPSALLRTSLSSIPYPSHIDLVLNGEKLDLTKAFPAGSWEGSLDRRWLEVPLSQGLPGGENLVSAELTAEGLKAKEGQGGKMTTSLEIMEYGGEGRFNASKGFIGAFPTYDLDGKATLRPMNEECLMRRVTHPRFCPVCAAALETSLRKKIIAKAEQSSERK